MNNRSHNWLTIIGAFLAVAVTASTFVVDAGWKVYGGGYVVSILLLGSQAVEGLVKIIRAWKGDCET